MGSLGAEGSSFASAEAVLTHVCAKAGLDAQGAQLVRLGSAAVFRLAAPVIVRIGRNGERLVGARREVDVARWLYREGVSATRALAVEQPVRVDEHVATFWESAADDDRYGSTADLARLLRALHRLDAPVEPQLSALEPFAKAEDRLNAPTLTAEDQTFLRARLDALSSAYQQLRFQLAPGVIHGDASVGNVILDREGAPLLVDLDGVAIGPREWDLVLTALYFDRFGWHSAEEYAAFVEIMGVDVMAWPGYELLADVREFLMVVWLAHTASDDKKQAELAKRLTALRTGGSRRDWSPY